ncbi:glycine oxidase ThiO [Gracilibacillus marinus]|uniref:glycine oxidase n=1 Tax=Gracilibacillus marinus TaxID=630535 RepID=A0ABV8VVW9_9BACI
MVTKHVDCIVIGGGVIGCSIAYELSKRSYRVLLLEKEWIGSGASNAAAGMLGAQSECKKDSPLFQLAKESRAMYPSVQEELKEKSGIDIQFNQNGILKLAYTEEQLKEWQGVAILQQKLGEDAHVMSVKEIMLKEKHLASCFLGGIYLPNDGQVSAPHVTKAYAKACENNGVIIYEHSPVTSLIEESNEVIGVKVKQDVYYSDHVIMATGKDPIVTSKFLHDMIPVKGECISVKTETPVIQSTIFGPKCYLVPKQNGKIIIGATSVPNVTDQGVSVKAIAHLLHHACELIPSLQEARVENYWSGIRPLTKDENPYIGAIPNKKGLYIATGHYRNGILLAPITGKIIADMIEKKSLASYLSAFSIQREVSMSM